MMKKQSGFGAIEAVIAVVVVVAIGLAGWYVWDNKSDNSKPRAETIEQSEQTADTAQEEAVVEKTVYSKVPSDLQEAILKETQANAPGCVKNGQIVDYNGKVYDNEVTYETSGFAITGIGCDGSSSYLFVKKNGAWESVAHTQEGFQCTLLKNNKVSVKLLETAYSYRVPATCLTTNPSAEVTYTGP